MHTDKLNEIKAHAERTYAKGFTLDAVLCSCRNNYGEYDFFAMPTGIYLRRTNTIPVRVLAPRRGRP